MGIRNNQGLITASLIAGVSRLPAQMLINGSSEDPVFRYRGGDATTSVWPAWGYGEDLSIAGAGADVTPNQSSPILGPGDDSVYFNNAKYFEAGNNTFADVTTEDIVIEAVFRCRSAAVQDRIMGKYNGSTGWILQVLVGHNLNVYLKDAGADTISINSAAMTPDAWYHGICFIDKSGSGQWYLNGAASGSASDITDIDSITVVDAMEIGASTGGNLPYTGPVAYLAMWKKDNWLDTHIQPAIARERFSLYTGNTSLHNHGDSTPVLL